MLILSGIVLGMVKLMSQTPFTTSVLEPRVMQQVTKPDVETKRFKAITEKQEILDVLSGNDEDSTKIESQTQDVNFFSNSGMSLSLLNEGESRVSVNTQVLHYKLYVASPKDDNTYSKYRINIPLMLLSKLSTNYDSIRASSALDALDYQGSPITLRVMPSVKLSFKNYNDVLFLGAYADARVLNTYSAEQDKYRWDILGSFGAGFTYQGDASAAPYDKDLNYYDGKFSFSAMFQLATGKQEVISSMFNTTDSFIMSLQAYLIVKLFDKESLNLRLGYQQFFKSTVAGTKTNISIALGI